VELGHHVPQEPACRASQAHCPHGGRSRGLVRSRPSRYAYRTSYRSGQAPSVRFQHMPAPGRLHPHHTSASSNDHAPQPPSTSRATARRIACDAPDIPLPHWPSVPPITNFDE
jgi:hypothetical protein